MSLNNARKTVHAVKELPKLFTVENNSHSSL